MQIEILYYSFSFYIHLSPFTFIMFIVITQKKKKEYSERRRSGTEFSALKRLYAFRGLDMNELSSGPKGEKLGAKETLRMRILLWHFINCMNTNELISILIC